MDGSAAARGASSPWGSCRLNAEGPVVGLLELLHARAQRRGRAVLGQVVLEQAEAAGIEITRGGSSQEGIQLAQAPVLTPVVAQVLPRLEPRRGRLCRRDGGAFVREQLAQGGPRAGLPIVVVAAQLPDEAPQVGATRGRRIADHVCHLVCD